MKNKFNYLVYNKCKNIFIRVFAFQAKICFTTVNKFSCHRKKFPVTSKNVLVTGKCFYGDNLLDLQNFFCWRQNFFCWRQNFLVTGNFLWLQATNLSVTDINLPVIVKYFSVTGNHFSVIGFF
jgi:hypothetical protein